MQIFFLIYIITHPAYYFSPIFEPFADNFYFYFPSKNSDNWYLGDLKNISLNEYDKNLSRMLKSGLPNEYELSFFLSHSNLQYLYINEKKIF